jgi:hypothetical protein
MEDRDAIEAKPRGHELDESLADAGDSHSARRLALNGGHGSGIAVTAHIAEEFDIGIGIDDEPEKRNAVLNGRADMGHAPAVDVHARAVAINGSRELKVAEQVHNHALQFLNIAGDRAADSFQ